MRSEIKKATWIVALAVPVLAGLVTAILGGTDPARAGGWAMWVGGVGAWVVVLGVLGVVWLAARLHIGVEEFLRPVFTGRMLVATTSLATLGMVAEGLADWSALLQGLVALDAGLAVGLVGLVAIWGAGRPAALRRKGLREPTLSQPAWTPAGRPDFQTHSPSF